MKKKDLHIEIAQLKSRQEELMLDIQTLLYGTDEQRQLFKIIFETRKALNESFLKSAWAGKTSIFDGLNTRIDWQATNDLKGQE